jgi:hypothetical protein
VDRLARISREGDRPERDAEERRRRAARRQPDPPEGDEQGPGHIDIRV